MLFTIISLFCSINLRTDSCTILGKVKNNKISHLSPDIKSGFETTESILLNQKDYKELFETEMVETDSCYLFGKFNINEDRIGVYSYKTTYECDHRIGMIEFSIFEKCKIIDSKTISFKDYHSFIFSLSSKFNKDFTQLTITEKRGSEYRMEPEAITDTIFTTIYKIDLQSKKLDTVYKKAKFELLESPPQK
jgi:hypothetical protein